jgi:hypothetical protein
MLGMTFSIRTILSALLASTVSFNAFSADNTVYDDGFSFEEIASSSMTFKIKSRAGDQCLNYFSNNAPLKLEAVTPFSYCAEFATNRNGNIEIQGLLDQCLDDFKGSEIVGNWSCNNGSNQKWSIKPGKSGTYRLMTGNNWCLTDMSKSSPQTPVQIRRCHDNLPGSYWKLAL